MRHLFFIVIIIGASLGAAGSVSAQTLPERVKGKILLDVEKGGEAWYVSPVSGFRYRLRTPEEAYAVMRTFGVGIRAQELGLLVPADAVGVSYPSMAPFVAGRILLDVDHRGAAWYVDPDTLRRYPLGSATEAFRVMTRVGLGISSADLAKIPQGVIRGSSVSHEVSFVPQAPFGEWWDARQDEGCEEASVYMAVNWARGNLPIDYGHARDAIIGASELERTAYGTFQDTSVADTADRIMHGFFGFTDMEVRTNIGANDIVAALHTDAVVVVGVNARKLGDPWYSYPPPLQHMILVIGYDPLSDKFIVHDPGTRRGASMRFDATVLERALLDYPTGNREPIVSRPASMIVTRKSTL